MKSENLRGQSSVDLPNTRIGKPKAYSYVRFSTPEQAGGDSYRRQTDLARRYAEANHLELDTSLRFDDLGVSAFRGRNAETGALRVFLQAVNEGVVPQGSYLIVESLDRISRQTARKAAHTLEDIVDAGVRVVDLSDGGKVYDTAALDDGFGFLFMTIRFMRAHEESAMKALRLANTYEEKRRIAASGVPQAKPFTRMLPAWLRWNEGECRHEVIPERATIVQDIFAKADAGWSKHRITHALNQAGEQPWGAGKRKGRHWHSSYIQKLLTNAAVIGTFTPHRVTKGDNGARKRTPQAPVLNYFPAVVDPDLFARVSAQALARAARGKYAGTAVRSIFAGLIRCSRCGGSVVRVSKGKHVYLVCSKAHGRAGCAYLAVPYADAETAVVAELKRIEDWAPLGMETADLESEIERQATNVEAGWQIARELADTVARTKSEASRQRLREIEEELAELEKKLLNLRNQRDTLASQTVIRRLKAIQAAIAQTPMNVSEVNKALKQSVRKIVLNPEAATITFHWHHAEHPSEPLRFETRHQRFGVM
jgi:DNA invertase Pin-like site-specific DNA recombinase